MKSTFSFINRTNYVQCEWARNYLKNQGYSTHHGPGADVRDFLDTGNFPGELYASLELLIAKMRAAWRQKAFRDKQKSMGNRACSFFLPNKSLRHLEQLADEIGETANATLEQIIEETYFRNKEIKQQNRKFKRKPLPMRQNI